MAVVTTTLTRFGASEMGVWWTSSWAQASAVQAHFPAEGIVPARRTRSTVQPPGADAKDARPFLTGARSVVPPQVRITSETRASATEISSGASARASDARRRGI